MAPIIFHGTFGGDPNARQKHQLTQAGHIVLPRDLVAIPWSKVRRRRSCTVRREASTQFRSCALRHYRFYTSGDTTRGDPRYQGVFSEITGRRRTRREIAGVSKNPGPAQIGQGIWSRPGRGRAVPPERTAVYPGPAFSEIGRRPLAGLGTRQPEQCGPVTRLGDEIRIALRAGVPNERVEVGRARDVTIAGANRNGVTLRSRF